MGGRHVWGGPSSFLGLNHATDVRVRPELVGTRRLRHVAPDVLRPDARHVRRLPGRRTLTVLCALLVATLDAEFFSRASLLDPAAASALGTEAAPFRLGG